MGLDARILKALTMASDLDVLVVLGDGSMWREDGRGPEEASAQRNLASKFQTLHKKMCPEEWNEGASATASLFVCSSCPGPNSNTSAYSASSIISRRVVSGGLGPHHPNAKLAVADQLHRHTPIFAGPDLSIATRYPRHLEKSPKPEKLIFASHALMFCLRISSI